MSWYEISCSKRTYIRSIVNDYGQKLGSGATLIALRRTKSGDFDIKDALEVEKWIDELNA
jgi:tRNA pseudouridine55 synthase